MPAAAGWQPGGEPFFGRYSSGERVVVKPPPGHGFTFSRQAFARVLQFRLRLFNEEGAGKAGCAPHPRSHAPLCIKKKTAHEHTGSAETSGLPRAMVLRLIRALPGEPGFVVTIAAQTLLRNLTPTLGRQDHAISPYANASYVDAFAPEALASTAACPTSVTLANAPLPGTGWVH